MSEGKGQSVRQTDRHTGRAGSSTHMFSTLTAAVTFAGDSSFGDESIEMTEIRMLSMEWIGSQRSLLFS